MRLGAGVEGVGVVGPGLGGWDEARAVLLGQRPLLLDEPVRPAVAGLPPRERRRVTTTIALALAVAEQVAGPARPPLDAVFACSGGDTDVIHRICQALLLPEHPVSPAQFHNSVHNAPAGYWSIARGDQAATTSLSAFDASFAAGLIEALTRLAGGSERVLLLAYDTPAPPPIWPYRPLVAPFAVALLLAAAGGMATINASLAEGGDETGMADPVLERLRAGNPAARALPLLRLLALNGSERVVLPYLRGQTLVLDVRA